MHKNIITILKKIIIVNFIIFSFNLYAKKPILTIYTYNSFSSPWGPGQKIKNIFEKQYNCEIKFISMSNSISLLNRLKIEGKLNKADIVLGLDNNLIKDAEATELFVKHGINLNKINNIKLWSNKFFLPYDYSYFSFIYKKNKIFNPPKNFEELINNNKWKIIYEDPRTSTLGLGLLLWIQQIYGNNSDIIWKKISKKTVTITKGWSEAYKLFLRNETDFIFGYTTSVLHFLINFKTDEYQALNFSTGHPMQIEIIGQLNNSKQPMLAKKFMQFIISKKCQKILAIDNWMYPVIKIKLPKEFFKLSVPKILSINISKKLKSNIKWINIWKKNIIQ